ncbi:MAG: 3-oxoacid CoA-transferase subunit B [Spirochaetales bacterium]|nr:3-oxoacid CoA-transferase subunit B [Spirochaetales bacterium]
MDAKAAIARRIAMELHDGQLVNLGIGLPTMVADYLPEGVEILLQSENGFVGLGPSPQEGEIDEDLINAGAQSATILDGGCFFDSATSFAIIRGGRLDVTVLGTLEVDEEGNIANYIIPGKIVPGMGGAMDLCAGAQRVVVATTHCDRRGNPKILQRCRLPLTARGEADLIVTELAVIERQGGKLVLVERAPEVSVEEILQKTEATLEVPSEVAVRSF